MVYSQALADRAAAWLALPLTDKRSADGLLELATIWAATQGQPLPECLRQCQYSERARAVAAYLREFSHFSASAAMSDTQPTSTYQFKPEYAGQTLTADDYGKAVTADTLTDEDAEHFIQKGFGHVFQKIGAAVGNGGEAVPTDLVLDKPLVPQADLEAEQAAHATTNEALVSEKTAHEATKAQLTEAQRQLTEAQETITDLNAKLAKKKQPAADASHSA